MEAEHDEAALREKRGCVEGTGRGKCFDQGSVCPAGRKGRKRAARTTLAEQRGEDKGKGARKTVGIERRGNRTFLERDRQKAHTWKKNKTL